MNDVERLEEIKRRSDMVKSQLAARREILERLMIGLETHHVATFGELPLEIQRQAEKELAALPTQAQLDAEGAAIERLMDQIIDPVINDLAKADCDDLEKQFPED